MEIPNSSHPIWQKLVKGEYRPDVQFLATKILLNKLVTTYQMDASPSLTDRGIEELRKLFTDNIKLPKVQSDLKIIFGKEILL